MTWTRISDDYADDCWTLSDQAFRLHTEGLCWSNRKLLDCRIPKDDVRRFAKHPDAVTELLAVGWWTEDTDCYVIRHHAQYQRAREQVLAQQAANAENGRKGGRPRKPREQVADLQKTQSVNDSPTESETQRDGTGRERPALQEDEVEDAPVEVLGPPAQRKHPPDRPLSVVSDDPAAVGALCSEFVAGNKRCTNPPTGRDRAGRPFCAAHLEARTA